MGIAGDLERQGSIAVIALLLPVMGSCHVKKQISMRVGGDLADLAVTAGDRQ